MQLTFKAINESGKKYSDTMEAEDRYELARILKERGDTLLSVQDKGGPSALARLSYKINMATARVKLKEKIFFAQNLAAMLSAGLPISRALGVTERQTKNEKFKDVIRKLMGYVQEGRSFSDGLKEFPKVFPSIFVSMVRAGEEGGRVSESLITVSSQLEQSYQLKKRIKGAMMYPSIIMGAMVIVGILLMMFVVPTLTATFVELKVELPASTKFIIVVSDFMKNNSIITLAILVGLVGAVVAVLKQPWGKRGFEWISLHLPVIKGLVQEANSAQTTRTLSSLLSSGVEVVSALGITKDVLQNSYYKEVLAQAEERIQTGKPMSEVFIQNEHLYPILVGEMMAVGEEVGDIAEMMERIAVFYEEDVAQKTKDLSTIIEPILMIVIGAVVGFFAVSMISPIYSLSSGI